MNGMTLLKKLIVAIAFSAVFSINAQTSTGTSSETSTGGSGTSSGSVVSGASPQSVPLVSTSMLKAYALAVVSNIRGQVSGDSVSGTKRSFNVSYSFKDADAEHMGAVAAAQTLSFTADPTEKLQTYMSYATTTVIPGWEFELFWGYTNFYLAKVDGVWQMPPSAKKLHLSLSDYIPMYVPDISGAYIEKYDDAGNYVDYYNFAWDGRVHAAYNVLILGKKFVNQNAKLFIEKRDGSKIIYNIKKEGAKIPLSDVLANGSAPAVDGARSVASNSASIIYGDGDEIVRASYTQDTVVNVSFAPAQTKYPIKVSVVDAAQFAADPLNTIWTDYNPYQNPVKFIATSGRSYLIRFDMPEPPAELPNYNGGGGEGKG
jgi:hypothetical protein